MAGYVGAPRPWLPFSARRPAARLRGTAGAAASRWNFRRQFRALSTEPNMRTALPRFGEADRDVGNQGQQLIDVRQPAHGWVGYDGCRDAFLV